MNCDAFWFRQPINLARLPAPFEKPQTASDRTGNEAINMKEKATRKNGDRKDSFHRNLFLITCNVIDKSL